MRLPLSQTDPVDVVLCADPDVARANPDRPDGTSPLRLYAETGDWTHLEVPEGASVFTIRPLSSAERRRLETATFRVDNQALRYREPDERVYARLVKRIREITGLRIRESLRLALGEERALQLPALDAPTFEAALKPEEKQAAAQMLAKLEQDRGSATGEAIAALSEADYEAYIRHVAWDRAHSEALVRKAVLAMTNPAVEAGEAGFPVEVLFGDEDAAVIDELAGHILRVSRLPKAQPQSSGGSSGAATSGARPGAAHAPGSAAVTSTRPTAPSSPAASGG